MEFLAAMGLAFVAIFPVELPDKTFIATLVLSTRYPAWSVWIGVVLAFGVQTAVAVGAGHLIAQLPQRPVQLVAAALFAVGAAVLIRGARKVPDLDEVKVSDKRRNGIWASFLVLFAAEWGDLSQLLTAGLVASGRNPWGVGVGAWLGLAVVSGLAVVLGKWLLTRVKLSLIRYVGGAVCGLLAIVTLISAW